MIRYIMGIITGPMNWFWKWRSHII